MKVYVVSRWRARRDGKIPVVEAVPGTGELWKVLPRLFVSGAARFGRSGCVIIDRLAALEAAVDARHGERR